MHSNSCHDRELDLEACIGAIRGTGAKEVESCTTRTAGIPGTIGLDAGAVIRPPIDTSSENGTRNFIDAASHSQYRVRALLLLSRKQARAAVAANKVDCHK
jgi:hypothetical protein